MRGSKSQQPQTPDEHNDKGGREVNNNEPDIDSDVRSRLKNRRKGAANLARPYRYLADLYWGRVPGTPPESDNPEV